MVANRSTKPKRGRNKKFHFEMTSFSLFLWSFFLLFVLAWTFVLGIFVGKGFLPGGVTTLSDLKTQIAKLQEMVVLSKRTDGGMKKGEETDPKLGFYEELSRKKEEAKKKTFPITTGKVEEPKKETVKKMETPSETPQEAKKGASLKGSDTLSAAARGEGVKGGAESMKKPPGISPETGKYTIQLASLEERSKAETMTRTLKTKGFDAYFYVVNVKDKTYYRVRSGRFKTQEEAKLHVISLEKGGFKGFVTKFE